MNLTFSYERNGSIFNSENIIAEKMGTSGLQIILGAHYDTSPSNNSIDRSLLQGTNDNASGVGLLMELAEAVNNLPDLTREERLLVLLAIKLVLIFAIRKYLGSILKKTIRRSLPLSVHQKHGMRRSPSKIITKKLIIFNITKNKFFANS